MCLQDIQIQQRTSWKSEAVSDGGTGVAVSPDLSRALWVVCYVNAMPVPLYRSPSGGDANRCPVDAHFSTIDNLLGWVSREQVGADVMRRLYAISLTPFTATFVWSEYDSSVDEAAHLPLLE